MILAILTRLGRRIGRALKALLAAHLRMHQRHAEILRALFARPAVERAARETF